MAAKSSANLRIALYPPAEKLLHLQKEPILMTKKTQIQPSEPVTARDQITVPTTEISTVAVENKIIVLRDTHVILDRDIADLYGVETKVLNQAVKRNINRFPERFMFQLTKDECSRSQFVTMNTGRGYNIKYLPYAFTEQGVAMLSSALRPVRKGAEIAEFAPFWIWGPNERPGFRPGATGFGGFQ